MTTPAFDQDSANRAIGRIQCMNLSFEAARWRIYRKLNPANVIIMIHAETEKNTFFTYAGDALKLAAHAAHPTHTSIFGGQNVTTVALDLVEAQQTIADLEKTGIDILFIR